MVAIPAGNLLELSQKLTISDGLAHNGVTCILEDSKGYLWIGTYDGINVYNGYELITYKNTIYNQVLASNRVRSLAEDSKGNIWIGTDEGVSIYDYETERFSVVYSQKTADKNKNSPIVRKIVVSKDGAYIFCLTQYEGILVFDKQNQLITKCMPEGRYNDLIFFDGVELDSSNYIFTTTAGLFSFQLESFSFKFEIPHDNGISNASILLVGNNILATRNRGVSIVDWKKENGQYAFRLKTIKYENEQLNSISIDKLGNLWVGTNFKGVVRIKNANAFILGEPYEENRYSSERDNLITSSVRADISSGCWVTTFNRGVYRFDIEDNPFKSFDKDQGEMYNLYDNSVSHIAVWDQDRVFLSAPRGGFGLFNTKTGRLEPLPFEVPDGIGYFSSVFVDSRKDIWLKVTGGLGLCRIRYGDRKLSLVGEREYGIDKDIRPRTISEDQFGNIWMGGESGVYKISVGDNGSILNVEELNQHLFFQQTPIYLVRCIYVDPLHNYIWIGTDSDGLIRIDNQKSVPITELEIHRSLRDKNKEFSISSNFVSTIVRLPNDDLWIGTERGGICKVFDYDKDPKFIAFTEKDGLSNNVVKRIFYDHEYNLWVATNVGLNKFFVKDHHFRSFYESDGLPFEDFWYSFGKLNNGNVVLSGMKGICYFKPEDIIDDESLPRLEFSKLRVFNQVVAPGDTINNRVLLKKRLNSTSEIELKHNENVFSLEVNSLHFSSPDNHYIKYQLSPVNKEWIQVKSGQRVISYSGLQHGEYILRVMASNSLHEWTAPKELHIVVKPPIWQTMQAYVLYMFFIALIIFVVMYFVLKLQSLKHNLHIEHLEKDKQKEINVAKLRFFSNISHEIKTPLTLISGPINILAERFHANSDVSDKLKIVQRQSKKISRLVDQVHDFQRLEANLLKMDITQFCFDDFINELKTDFEFLARSEKKVFSVQGEDATIYVSADRDKLEKIFNNIINSTLTDLLL